MLICLKDKLKVGIPVSPGNLLEMHNFENHLRTTEFIFVFLKDSPGDSQEHCLWSTDKD